MVAAMRERFKDFGLTFSIGGQISFDAFPNVRPEQPWYLLQIVHLHCFSMCLSACAGLGQDLLPAVHRRTLR